MGRKLAIIDLGSNSLTMIIVEIYNDGSYKMLDQAKEMVRLSEGMGDEKILKPDAIKRTIYTLRLFNNLIKAYQVDEIICVATAAVRSANNKDYFIEEIKKETGFEVKIISGEEEAYYGYLGVINTIQVQDCIIVDIGGASTELALVKNRTIKETLSLPFGAVVLTENYLDKDVISSEKVKKLEDFLISKYDSIEWLKKAKGLPIIGVGGTIRTIAKVDKKRIKFPIVRLHNYQVTDKEVSYIYEKVISTDLKGRKKIPGVNKERADIIAGGIVPIKCLMKYLETKRLIISGNGLREGLFYEKYFEGKKDRVFNEVLYHSVYNILKRYNVNIKHSEHVQKLALSLFDQTYKLHGFGKELRKLLSVASLLHDIGMYVDYYNHHIHGFYLILNSRLYGLSNRELIICAFLVGRHRDVAFKENIKKYSMLINKDDYDRIKKLSTFLKMAEKLDRSESGSIDDIRCEIDSKKVNVILKAKNNPELEIAAVKKYENDFKKQFGRKLYIYSDAKN